MRVFAFGWSQNSYQLVRTALGRPEWTDRLVRLHLIRERRPNLRQKPGQRDAWPHFPEHTINEPDKAWPTSRIAATMG